MLSKNFLYSFSPATLEQISFYVLRVSKVSTFLALSKQIFYFLNETLVDGSYSLILILNGVRKLFYSYSVI